MILFAGPPGAGKSVQASMLGEKRKIVWLSTGALLRATDDEEIKKVMLKGELVDDNMVHRVVEEAIDAVPDDHVILMDGYPRSEDQIVWFLNFIESHHRNIRNALHIKLPIEKAVKRLLLRGRADDDEDVIRSRYAQYEREVKPMLNHLERLNIHIHDIDGDNTVEKVHDLIIEAVGDELDEHDNESKDQSGN